MLTKAQKAEALEILRKTYPNAKPALLYSSPFELLVATILSAQSTDVMVNKCTRALFPVANTPAQFAKMSEEELCPYIKSCGFYRMKGRHIIETSRILVTKFDGEVPADIDPGRAERRQPCRGLVEQPAGDAPPARVLVDGQVRKIAGLRRLSARARTSRSLRDRRGCDGSVGPAYDEAEPRVGVERQLLPQEPFVERELGAGGAVPQGYQLGSDGLGIDGDGPHVSAAPSA